jgi:hypothetical protein
MQEHNRLHSLLRSGCGKLGSGNGEVAPRAVLRGATFAPLAVVFQKSLQPQPTSDTALAIFMLLFFGYVTTVLVAEWLRPPDKQTEPDKDQRSSE